MVYPFRLSRGNTLFLECMPYAFFFAIWYAAKQKVMITLNYNVKHWVSTKIKIDHFIFLLTDFDGKSSLQD